MKIVVLGFGRMGSWLVRELSGDHLVAVYDTDGTKQGHGPDITRLNSLHEVRKVEPDLLINAVTLRHTVTAFEDVAPYLPHDCILCDVTSIKGKIADYYAKAGFRFVSVHPMFGPTFADMDALLEENAVIIAESCSEGRDFFRGFFTRRHVRLFEYTFEEHDRTMAYSLTTPFVASLVFAACVDAKAVPGTTFTRHMAIARSLLTEDDHLLAEILFNPYSLAELAKITSRLEFLKHVIKAQDQDEAREFFRRLKENIGEGESLNPSKRRGSP
jgi:prephenate dehydrogenase